MTLSIKLTDNERQLAESYARLHSLSLGEAFKKALFEKIEDEFDLTVAEEAHREFVESNETPVPIEQLWAELDI